MKYNFIFASVFLFLKSPISALPPATGCIQQQQEDIAKDNAQNDVQQSTSAFKRHFRRVTPYVFSNLFATPLEPLHQLNVIVVSHIMSESLRKFLDGLDEQYQSSIIFLKEIVEDFDTPVDIYTSPLISMDDVDALNIPSVNKVYEDARLFERNIEGSSENVLGFEKDVLHSFLEEKAQDILNVQSFHQSIMLEWAERSYEEMNVIILASPLWSLLWQTIACKKPISNIDLHHLSQLGSSQQHENRISIKLFQKRKGSNAFQYE